MSRSITNGKDVLELDSREPVEVRAPRSLRRQKALLPSRSLGIALVALGVCCVSAEAAVIVTNSTNLTLANTGLGQTSDSIVNGPVGAYLPYTVTPTSAFTISGFGSDKMNDDGTDLTVNSNSNFAIANRGTGQTISLTLASPQQVGSIAVYNGYANRDDGSYTLTDASGTILGAYAISATAGDKHAATDQMWFKFNTPVYTSGINILFDSGGDVTRSFREVQLFGVVPEPGSLALFGLAPLLLVRARRFASC